MFNHPNPFGFKVSKRKLSSAIKSSRHLERGIYLIELDPLVALDPVFLKANPHFVPGLPLLACYYCGSSNQSPQNRYIEHVSGGRNASRIAQRYGQRLRMDLVPNAGKRFPRERALKEEVRLARELRAKGFGVWQA